MPRSRLLRHIFRLLWCTLQPCSLGCCRRCLLHHFVLDDVLDDVRWQQPLCAQGWLGRIRAHEHHCGQPLDLQAKIMSTLLSNCVFTDVSTGRSYAARVSGKSKIRSYGSTETDFRNNQKHAICRGPGPQHTDQELFVEVNHRRIEVKAFAAAEKQHAQMRYTCSCELTSGFSSVSTFTIRMLSPSSSATCSPFCSWTVTLLSS